MLAKSGAYDSDGFALQNLLQNFLRMYAQKALATRKCSVSYSGFQWEIMTPNELLNGTRLL